VQRRHFLVSLVATGLGGCLSLDGTSAPSPGSQLGEVSIVNHDYEPHSVEVSVERDGTQVYSGDHEATAGDGVGLGGASVPCEWGTEVGAYVVEARLDTRTEWESIALSDYDADVLSLLLSIGDGTTERGDDPDLSFWTTSNANKRCSAPTETSNS
jgi:hypothetical protein